MNETEFITFLEKIEKEEDWFITVHEGEKSFHVKLAETYDLKKDSIFIAFCTNWARQLFIYHHLRPRMISQAKFGFCVSFAEDVDFQCLANAVESIRETLECWHKITWMFECSINTWNSDDIFQFDALSAEAWQLQEIEKHHLMLSWAWDYEFSDKISDLLEKGAPPAARKEGALAEHHIMFTGP